MGFGGEFGGSRAARADGADGSTWDRAGAGPGSLHAGSAITPRPWEQRTRPAGDPAGWLFDASAQARQPTSPTLVTPTLRLLLVLEDYKCTVGAQCEALSCF